MKMAAGAENHGHWKGEITTSQSRPTGIGSALDLFAKGYNVSEGSPGKRIHVTYDICAVAS